MCDFWRLCSGASLLRLRGTKRHLVGAYDALLPEVLIMKGGIMIQDKLVVKTSRYTRILKNNRLLMKMI